MKLFSRAQTQPETGVQKQECSVAVLPFNTRLPHDASDLELCQLFWPIGRPERQNTGTVADMRSQDHLVLFPQEWFWYSRLKHIGAKVSLAITEPRAYHRQHYILARLLHRRFHRIVTSDPVLANAIPNGIVIPFGTTWVPEWESLDTSKDRNLSLIASSKRSLSGHKLRHTCVNWLRKEKINADVMGRGYEPFERKSDGLARYRFSVIIENSREVNYFTEKLIDAILCRTIPIYWGCPNIGDYFDTRGMIICETFDDVQNAIRSAGPKLYDEMRFSLEANISIAAYYANYHERLANALLE